MTADQTFADLGVGKSTVAALSRGGITAPFPIQTAVIAAALDGRDICGRAPTGSGKTLAFGIPVVERARTAQPWHPAALVLTPTRELATQIKAELEPLAKARGRSIATVFGGTNIARDINRLERGVDILVACPGRLEDLISRRCCDLRDADVVVVDEADRMCDMGFLPSVRRILDLTPDDRHTLLFSATLDKEVNALIDRYQHDPVMVEVESPIETPGEVEHSWYKVPSNNRIGVAADIIDSFWSTIVFCRTRRGCDRVCSQLRARGLSAVAIHGNRSQPQRERALRDFTAGKAQVLVATDVAARGIHVDDVSLVLHYDPAETDKDYVHRSGRTGRAGSSGRVISLVVEQRRRAAEELQRALGFPSGFESVDPDAFTKRSDERERHTARRPAAEPEPADTDDDRPSRSKNRHKGKARRGSNSSGKRRTGAKRKSKGGPKSSGSGKRGNGPNSKSKGGPKSSGSGKRGNGPNSKSKGGPKSSGSGKRGNGPGAKRKPKRNRTNSKDWYPKNHSQRRG